MKGRRDLRARLVEALPPPARAKLFHVLMLPDFERADRIGERDKKHVYNATLGE